GFGLIALLGGQFLPELHEGPFIVHVTAAPGTSIDGSLRLGAQVTQALLQVPFVRSVAQRAGRAAVDDTYGPQSSELEVDLKPLSAKEMATSAEGIRKALETLQKPSAP